MGGVCVALWGDSLGRGVVYDESRGRYMIAKNSYARLLAEQNLLNIQNHSRFGATVTEGLEDFLSTADIGAQFVAIEYGGNDCNLDWGQVSEDPERSHPARSELQTFERKLAEFVLAVRERGLSPVLVTPPPLIAQRFFAWVSKGLNPKAILRYLSGDVTSIYRWQERYAGAVYRAARSAKCLLFDLRDAFLAAPDLQSLYCEDGMHPNENGHRCIMEAIRGLLPALQISHRQSDIE